MSYQKLPADFKKKWVDALRRGEYKQGKDVLYRKSNNSYCCLGVAGSLCGLEPNEMHGIDIFVSDEFMRHASVEKQNLSAKAIAAGYPRLLLASGFDCVANKIASFNDDGDSFSEIADWIEENL